MAIVERGTVFATGADGATQPDSLTLGNGSLWAEYGNGADSTGAGGSSTIVQYDLGGNAQNTFSLAGSVDGLKFNPANGLVYALQNQDGNSTLTLIDPAAGTITGPLSYAVTSDMRGYDDAAFVNGQVYVSYSNPNGAGDPVVQRLINGNTPFGTLTTANILPDGATGYDISTGQADQPIPLSDPDSLKSTADGRLILTSGSDEAFTLISNPGTAAQSQRFVQLTNLPAGSSLDDVLIPTSSSGTFYVSNTGTNQILAYTVSGLNTSDAYASVGTEIVQVDLQTGAQTPLITGLSRSHGVVFVPTAVADPVVQSTSIFALGSEAGNATATDSLTMGAGSIWVEYGNGADATGLKPVEGNSTIVRYDLQGNIQYTFSLPGSIDGLKYDPSTGQVWALKNQDANSRLCLIDPQTNTASDPIDYGSPYVYGLGSAHGYDDVAFSGGKVFISYTNPASLGDPIVQMLDNGNSPTAPLVTTSILRFGDTGTNLLTGQVNQPLPITDPDSLKTLADGSLILTSDHDQSLTFIKNPGTDQQTASFVTLPLGSAGLDDAVIPSSTSGTFYVANGGANDVLKVNVTGLNTNDVYISVGSDNAVDQLDLTTGALTPIITGLNSPHGLMFVPSTGTSPAPAASIADIIKGIGSTLAQDLLAGSVSGTSVSTVLNDLAGLLPQQSASAISALLAQVEGLSSATGGIALPHTA